MENEIQIEMVDQSETTKLLMGLVNTEVRLVLLTDGSEVVNKGILRTHGLDFDGFAVELTSERSLIFMAEDVMTVGRCHGESLIVACR